MPVAPERIRSITEIGRLIDWTRLPAESAPIARLLLDGFSQREIAIELGRSDDWVSANLRELRQTMVEQALARSDELSAEVRGMLEDLRGGAAFKSSSQRG